MKVDQEALRGRMAQLSSEELTKILEVDFRNYNVEAITAATDELRSRNVPEKTLTYRPESQTPPPSPGSVRPKALSARQVVALVGIGLAGLLVLILVLMG